MVHPPACSSAADLEAFQFLKATQKRRMLGNIIFVGELHTHDLVNHLVMRACVNHLLEAPVPGEEELEALCKLLTTIGAKFDSPHKEFLDTVFQRVEAVSVLCVCVVCV